MTAAFLWSAFFAEMYAVCCKAKKHCESRTDSFTCEIWIVWEWNASPLLNLGCEIPDFGTLVVLWRQDSNHTSPTSNQTDVSKCPVSEESVGRSYIAQNVSGILRSNTRMRPDQRNQASECCQESGKCSHPPSNSKRQYGFQDLVSTYINHFLGLPQRILRLCTLIKEMSTPVEGTKMKNILLKYSKAEA